MSLDRRFFLKTALGGAVAAVTGQSSSSFANPSLRKGSSDSSSSGLSKDEVFDVAVIGAGVFGSWIALNFVRSGARVALVDAYGPANSRASSGDESRVIRAGYGPDELYSRWAMRSLTLWKEFSSSTGKTVFRPSGVLRIAGDDPFSKATEEVLTRLQVKFEKLNRSQLEKRFPQFAFSDGEWGLYEPEAGALLARQAVLAVFDEAVRLGVKYARAGALEPHGNGRLNQVDLNSGTSVKAGTFIFACGSWLGKLFPEVLGRRIFPTRQEVFYFGVPEGNSQFCPPNMPTWICGPDEIYGIPVLDDNRGLKIASDQHGPQADPDTMERAVSAESIQKMRAYLGKRFPLMASARISETRVCQYENTSNGDFLVDQHPQLKNVWLVGGGSGHGFKHGPAMGEHVFARIASNAPAEPRFSLATKQTVQKREVH
jgi:sarcosine oxidase